MNALNKEYIVDENVVSLHKSLENEIEEFLEEKKIYSKATYDNYKSDTRWIARSMFGLDCYSKLTLKHFEVTSVKNIMKFFTDLYNEGNIASTTLNRRISSLKGLLSHLVSDYGLQFDIVTLKSRFKPFPNNSIEIEVLSNEDTDRCVDEFKLINDEMYLLGRLAVDTGLRLNELLTLEWKQFSKEDDKVVIKSMGKIKGKGHKDWIKAISIPLYTEISALKSNGVEKVFTMHNSTVSRHMKKVIEKLGLSDKKYSFHSLRKNAVTHAFVSSNNNIMVAKEFANHSSVSTTQKYIATRNIETMGRISNGDVDKELFKEVSHSDLVNAVSKLDETSLIYLNRILANNVDSGKINTVNV